MIGLGWFDTDIPLQYERILWAIRITIFVCFLGLTPRLIMTFFKLRFWQHLFIIAGSLMMVVYYFDLILSPPNHNVNWSLLWFNAALLLMVFGSVTLSSKTRTIQEERDTEVKRRKTVKDRWHNRKIK